MTFLLTYELGIRLIIASYLNVKDLLRFLSTCKQLYYQNYSTLLTKELNL